MTGPEEEAIRLERGIRLRDARRANNMKQGEVGRALRPPRSRQAVSRWERGTESTLSEIRQLALLYGESLDWILLGIRTRPIGTASLQDIFRQREAAQADWPGGL